MTENKRFYIDKSGDLYDKQNNDLLMLDFGYAEAIYVNSVLEVLNQLHEENQKLKNYLKEIGYEVKKYSYEETGKKIEDYNTEKLLISLLQNIITDLQNDWIVVDYTSDFTNDLDLRTNQVVEQNISMDIKLKMDGIKWLMIG